MGHVREFLSDHAQRFQSHANALVLQPAFDPRSRLVYVIGFLALITECGLIVTGGYSFGQPEFVRAFALLILLLGIAQVTRRYGFPRLATAMEACVLPLVLGALTAAGSFFTTVVSGPMADGMLSSMDHALGFSWRGLFELYREWPWLVDLSRYAYRSMHIQIAIVPVLLVIFRQDDRLWTLLTAMVLVGLCTIAIHPFFPAAGPYLQYGIQPGEFTGLPHGFPWDTGPKIEAIRDGSLRDVTGAMAGLVSFPSYHAASAVMLGWAGWRLPVIGAVLVVLNAGMWLSTLISGSHYLSDVLAGTAVAVVGLALANRFVMRVGRRAMASSAD